MYTNSLARATTVPTQFVHIFAQTKLFHWTNSINTNFSHARLFQVKRKKIVTKDLDLDPGHQFTDHPHPALLDSTHAPDHHRLRQADLTLIAHRIATHAPDHHQLNKAENLTLAALLNTTHVLAPDLHQLNTEDDHTLAASVQMLCQTPTSLLLHPSEHPPNLDSSHRPSYVRVRR